MATRKLTVRRNCTPWLEEESARGGPPLPPWFSPAIRVIIYNNFQILHMNSPNYNKTARRNNKMFCMHFSSLKGGTHINNGNAACKSCLAVGVPRPLSLGM